jgi:replicative superfamily II helicase
VVNNGRVAAHFYIQAESVATFNEMFEQSEYLSDADLFRIICSATEFRNMKLRPEEMEELQKLASNDCPFGIKGAGHDDVGRSLISDAADKAFVLLQAYISRAKIKGFTLVSDMNYIASNAGRVARALFEICLKREKAEAAGKFLRIAKSLDSQCWWFLTPLRHFVGELNESTFAAIETYHAGRKRDTLEDALSLLDMQPEEVGQLCKANKEFGKKIQKLVRMLPRLHLTCDLKPITSSVVKFQVHLTADFEWNTRWHGNSLSFWLLVEEVDRNKIHHAEHITQAKRSQADPLVLDFSIPVFDTNDFHIRVVSESWVGVESSFPVRMRDIKMPAEKATQTDLLDLTPLPTTALNNPKYEQLYTKFKTFNPVCLKASFCVSDNVRSRLTLVLIDRR